MPGSGEYEAEFPYPNLFGHPGVGRDHPILSELGVFTPIYPFDVKYLQESRMIAIRPEEQPDIPAISEIHRSAFGGETEAMIVDAVRASPGFIRDLSLVAEKDGQVVGHILFSPVHIETAISNRPALALAPIAVLPGYQKQGIGSRLVEEGLRSCRDLGHSIVIVVGEPSFYTRFGFTPARARGLEAPFPVPDDVFRVLEIRDGALKGITGMVCYPPPFLAGLE
jgi:putative acetyltransferase